MDNITIHKFSTLPVTLTDESLIAALLRHLRETPGAYVSIYHDTKGGWSYSVSSIEQTGSTTQNANTNKEDK